ncbi:DNA polymerase III subunit delta [Paenibacillus hunanensis]|uniref:DNA polymerase III subunit delta n=1 Tax=Paenibacillus hunanensis TaxID=539262 RepID=UPI00202604AB|nr:DNA polymerase III subunit delta [Paenibacillus hunanensis]MCL9660590.1 DNA polymerase III subunit delta [Paenibacillus hunanensis]
MDLKAASKEIQNNNPAPIYVCYGAEKYRINEFVDFAIQHLIEPEHRDFALARYDLSETPLETVLEDAEEIPFMVPRKVIIIRDSSVLAAGKDNGKIEHRTEALLRYMEEPVDYSILLFWVNAEKLDERKKVVKALKNKACLLPFQPMNADELLTWLIRHAKKQECECSKSAAEALVQAAGTTLGILSAEMDKLCLHAGRGGTITEQDVEKLVARSTEQNVFILVEQIAAVRLEKALTIFYDLLKQREEPIKIAALIARQFRIMLQVKELAGQNYSQQQIASQLSLHPYAVKIAGEQARRFEATKLRSILAHLARLDYQMKSGAIDKVLGLEMFLLRLGA